jgi:hypothetical protein
MILVDLLPYIGLLLLTVLVPLFVKNKKTYMFFLFFVFFVFSGFRYGVGWDYYNYANAIEFGGYGVERMDYLPKQLAFFCSNHGFTQLFFVVTSFIIISFFFVMFFKESEDPAVSIFVFLCVPTFFLMSLTLVRYFLAVSAVFLSFYYGYKKKYVPYFGLLIVAFLCHRAALFGIVSVPFVLFKLKFNLKTNLIIFITCFVLGTIAGAFDVVNSVFSVLSESDLLGDIFESGEQYMQDVGTSNFSRTPYFFAALNLIGLFALKDKTKENPQLGYYITMFNIGCSLMFLFSFNTIFANRLSVLFTVFLAFIVPYYKKGSIPRTAVYAMIIFFFFYGLTVHATHPLFIGRQNCFLPYRMNLTFY